MIPATQYKPVCIPNFADLDTVEIDRVQSLDSTANLNRVKIEEIGREGVVSWRNTAPSVTVNIKQLEYGSLEFWRKLANKGDSVQTISFTDFKTTAVDVAGYQTDDSGTFLGTIWYPGLRVNSLNLNIGDPESIAERTFGLVGEDKIMLQGTNKYLIHNKQTIAAGNNSTLTISGPSPVIDPDNSGRYIFRVVRVRAGAGTELIYGTDWSSTATVLTVNGTSLAGDVIKYWYSAGSYISGQNPFTLNDTDIGGVIAEACSIYLQNSNYLYRLQSVAIDSTFDRFDIREIGNKDTVARGVKDITHRITLGRILETYDIEEILRGSPNSDYPKIDIRRLSNKFNLIIKLYADNTKTTFKMGYKFLDITPTGFNAGANLNDYVNQGVTLEAEEGIITTVNAIL